MSALTAPGEVFVRDVTSPLSTMGARTSGIRDLPGVGSLEGRRLGFVEGILGEVHCVDGVSLGPLSPPLGGLCVKVVPLLVELGPHLLELLVYMGHKPAHTEASSSFTVAPRAFISSRRRRAVALASATRASSCSWVSLRAAAMRSSASFALCDSSAMDADILASGSETVGMISCECDG